jgi:hypothetical protein
MHHVLGSFSVDLGPCEISNPNIRSGDAWTRGSNVSKWPGSRRRPARGARVQRVMSSDSDGLTPVPQSRYPIGMAKKRPWKSPWRRKPTAEVGRDCEDDARVSGEAAAPTHELGRP